MVRCIEVTATSFAIAMALAGSAQATPAETRGAVGVPGLIACSQAALATGIEAANVVDTGVIELPPGCTITLDGTANAGTRYDAFGPTGLPPITGRVILIGHGGALQRAAGAPAFRLLTVTDGARLDLVDIMLEDGHAIGGRGGDSDAIPAQIGGGGGGGGLGGDGGTGHPSGGGGGGSFGDGGDSNFGSGGGGAGGGGIAGLGGDGETGTFSGGGAGQNGGGGGGAYRGEGGAGGPGGGGGGGGAAGGSSGFSTGGAGGFGGGGGGGGGNGNNSTQPGGAGGFGGGDGGDGKSIGMNSSGGGGGGGAGLGGGIFLDTNGELTADDEVTFLGNIAEGGDGGTSIDGTSGGGGGGSGFGGALFSRGSAWFAGGVTSTSNDAIAGSGGSGSPAGLDGEADAAFVYPVGSQSAANPTTTTADDIVVIYNPDSQSATASVTVTADSGIVDGGKVVMIVYGENGTPVTPGYEQMVDDGGSNIPFQVPAGLPVGEYALHVTFAGARGEAYTASTDTSHTLQVVPGAAVEFEVDGFPSPTRSGSPHEFDVVAYDAFGHVATGFDGLVHFTSSDPDATLPADAQLVDGSGTFTATLRTFGSQNLGAIDAATGSIGGEQDGIVVAAADAHLQISTPEPIVSAGAVVEFQATVSNDGVFASNSVSVDLATPPELDGTAWSCVASVGATCAAGGTGPVHDVAALAVGASATYTITGLAPTDSDQDEWLEISGTVQPSDQPDQQPGNNTAQSAVLVGLFLDGFDPD
jgi:hypothetical protein